jgi:hypothetical protein
MLIDKGDLLKVLRAVSIFDSQGCVYLGVQTPDDGKPQFHRSGPYGFIQTKDFDLMQGCVYASLANLKDLLNVSADVMDMIIDPHSRRLRMESTEEFPVRLQVHCVVQSASGFKPHYLGEPGFLRYSGDLFNGFDIRPFKVLTQYPVLENGRLMVSTVSGTVVWNGPDSLKPVFMQPREAFLRFIAGGGIAEYQITKQGYWMAEKDGLVCALYSPQEVSKDSLRLYSLPGTELARFHAPRLVTSLHNAAAYLSDTDKVELHPKDGIVCRDKYSNTQVFPHGASNSTWTKGAIFARTAKFIVDCLNQTTEDVAVLYSVPLRNPTYRIVRGNFEVNFGLV